MRIGRFNIGRKRAPQITPEEVLPKVAWLEPATHKTYLVGADAIVNLNLTPLETLVTYYNKQVLENLNSAVSYNVIIKMMPPPDSTSRMRFFQAPMVKKDGLLYTPTESLED